MGDLSDTGGVALYIHEWRLFSSSIFARTLEWKFEKGWRHGQPGERVTCGSLGVNCGRFSTVPKVIEIELSPCPQKQWWRFFSGSFRVALTSGV